MEQKVISVLGPSGGIGKSTIAKELAITFAKTTVNSKPLSVCIVDANLVFGAQKTFFKLAPKYSIEDWLIDYHAKYQNWPFQEAVDEYTWDKIEKYMSFSIEYNLFVLPSPSNGQYFQISLEELNLIIVTLRKFFDVIVIDTGNNLETVTVASMKVSDINLLLVTDEKRSLSSAVKLRARAREQEIPMGKFMPIINRYPDSLSERFYKVQEIENLLFMNVETILPNEQKMWAINNTHNAIVLDRHNSKLKKGILQLANKLVPEVIPKAF